MKEQLIPEYACTIYWFFFVFCVFIVLGKKFNLPLFWIKMLWNSPSKASHLLQHLTGLTAVGKSASQRIKVAKMCIRKAADLFAVAHCGGPQAFVGPNHGRCLIDIRVRAYQVIEGYKIKSSIVSRMLQLCWFTPNCLISWSSETHLERYL